MPIAHRLSSALHHLRGHIVLESSKSISNRALIIRSLCKDHFDIQRLSTSDDTRVLEKMLASDEEILYSGHAGSSYRFMLAKACLDNRQITLDASEQLRRRPIGPLVKALQTLGADITYLRKEGFPPVQITPAESFGKNEDHVTLQTGISSQYLTALLLIAPMLPNGLTIHLTDDPVSESYIQMTLAMMEYFGVGHVWEGHTIKIENGAYQPKAFTVEGDWSAASYFYSMAALSEKAEIEIDGLTADSIQGDSVTKDLYNQLGVETIFTEKGIVITKGDIKERPKEFVYDFSRCPDIAQTLMVTLAGLGIKGVMTGLQTLRIKETDRILAMHTELARIKTNVLVKEEGDDLTVIIAGKARWKDRGRFETHDDHRMAMALTPLALLNTITIKDPEVVSKSYPAFWKDVESIGLKCERLKVK